MTAVDRHALFRRVAEKKRARRREVALSWLEGQSWLSDYRAMVQLGKNAHSVFGCHPSTYDWGAFDFILKRGTAA